MKPRAAATVVAVLALACAGGSSALRLPSAPRCPVFPKSNPWNRRVDRLPVAKNSAAVIASIGASTGLHADFGSGLWQGKPIGIPFDVVTRKTPRSRVRNGVRSCIPTNLPIPHLCRNCDISSGTVAPPGAAR